MLSTNLWTTCKVHTALEQSFSPSISTLTDIHESERSITMVDGKLSSIMFHWYSIHEPHMGDSGLIHVVTGELEVSVKALVGGTSTCSRMTCSERQAGCLLQSIRDIEMFIA